MFPSLFPASTIAIGSVRVGSGDLGVIGVSCVALGAIYALSRTKLGLAIRAAASYPESSRALGIPVLANNFIP